MPEIKIIQKGSLEHQLIECCGKGSLGDVRALLDAGANVNARMPNEIDDWGIWYGGYSVAHIAAENPDIRIIKLLVAWGINVNVKDLYESTPLFYAARKNTLDMIKYLVSLGNDPLEINCDGENLLTASACNPHKDVLEYFLQKGVDIEGDSDIIPLGVAMRDGTPVDMDFFIEHGANKESALAYAHNSAPLENVRHLLEKGCDVNAVFGIFKDERYDLTKLPDGPRRQLFLEYGAKSDEELENERKIAEAQRDNFLEPDEVLIRAKGIAGLYKRGHVPENDQELLEGVRRLWIRIVYQLRNHPGELAAQEKSMNEQIEDAGGYEKISLSDDEDSYLDMLDPMIATGPGWGHGLLAFHENLSMMEGDPEVILTPEDEESRDPDGVAFDLMDELEIPLYDSMGW